MESAPETFFKIIFQILSAARPSHLGGRLSSEFKIKLSRLSASQGKKVSALVRKSIEEKLEQIEKKIFEDKMKQAYQGLAQENINISKDFKYADTKNL